MPHTKISKKQEDVMKIISQRVERVEENLVQLQREITELEESRKSSRQRVIIVQDELRQVQCELERLSIDYAARCRRALDSIEQKLKDTDKYHGHDACSIRPNAQSFLDASENLLSEFKLSSNITKLKQLAENIELIEDTFHYATLPTVNIEKLQANYVLIENKALEMEGEKGASRRFGSRMVALGLVLCAVGLISAYAGFAGTLPTFGLSLTLAMVGSAIGLLGMVLIKLGKDKFTSAPQSGLPQKMLFLSDSLKNKTSGTEPSEVPFLEEVRRAFR